MKNGNENLFSLFVPIMKEICCRKGFSNYDYIVRVLLLYWNIRVQKNDCSLRISGMIEEKWLQEGI